MQIHAIERSFRKIGARVRIGRWTGDRSFGLVRPRYDGVIVDVRRDGAGEYFDIEVDSALVDLCVVDTQPRDKHLLVMVRRLASDRKDKFLCGHDERHWFVAAVPPDRGVSSVRTALEALKPPAVRAVQAHTGVKAKHRNRRRNRAFQRQGEWFFISRPDLAPRPELALRNEALQRAGGKPHVCEWVVRQNGEAVHVCSRYPSGVSGETYRRILRENPRARNWGWRMMTRNARVYALGRVRHPDHRTLCLNTWHEVLMNTESQAPAMRHVAFLD
jgi:hypothetical protein